MTRLEGIAREAIVIEPTNPNDIITQLRAAIKTEPSKVIEGRILALRTERTNLTKFAERAEELAEQLRRSLITEGFSKPKAKELSIEKTVELCRKSARNDTVKAVLAASKFTEPKEVIAKMIVEINNLKLDNNSSQYTRGNGNHKKNGNGYPNKYSKNNNRNSNHNDHHQGHNNRRNSNNYRPNYSNNNNNTRHGQNNSNGRTFTNSNYRRTSEQNVRVITGNEIHPGNGGQTTEQAQ